jgi:IS30 family transposase
MEKNISVSIEGIYKFILSSKRRNEDLHKYLRHYRRRRRRFKRRNRYWELQYQRRKLIDDRPIEANKRESIGHWERDLMLGKRNCGGILTVVDRKTNYTLLEKIKTTFAKEVNQATTDAIVRARKPCLTITNDNGHEFGEFWELEKRLNTQIFFTHPLCPWERGTVENTIGLLRQFVPKGSDLNKLSADTIRELETTINSRPRKKLGFKTPIEIVSGKKQKLITQKRIESPSPEYYEQFYLTAEEIKKLRKLRGKTVALAG